MTALSPALTKAGSTSPTPRVTFRGVLRSEWIKLRSLRSSVWAAVLAVASTAMFTGLIVLGFLIAPTSGEDPAEIIAATFGARPAIGVLGFVILIAQSIVAVLGVLVVSTERGSGLLAVTATAVPRRTPILAAKLIVSATAGFVLGLVTSAISYLFLQPALAALGMEAWRLDAPTVQALIGGAVYLALIAVFGTALGSLFRSTAAGLGLVLGIVLAAPVLLPIIPVIGGTLARILPTSVGMLLFQPFDEVGWTTVLTGLAILLAEVAAAAVVAGVLWKRRDV
ncbi:ABC transporter permease [Naasia sp. SYSU D00057]|uniref:ABC transporter permease n=1 Tax=Naasia sp. SYSU D00057 TaxID=2817380 RepID=UPI001B30A7BB|nr:ABC transporter permease [Naasia sp. SYSU D00057]